ncbi:hypothetical protein B0T24DRAFT_140821 [Lasiosphaeria ovina]|uniref:Uncharacterized protein n=1 Tax=Lasiosphaeria ovina TaxID=92902 RepID=A0AAE0KM95_9PEZI|nr:hypothetical protein B0T24DRAFT_140821 [Lasiosphaeria ovina]
MATRAAQVTAMSPTGLAANKAIAIAITNHPANPADEDDENTKAKDDAVTVADMPAVDLPVPAKGGGATGGGDNGNGTPVNGGGDAGDNPDKHWVLRNPGAAACLAVAAGGVAVVAAPAIVTAPLLVAAGFGPGGVIGGSIAAAAQAALGNVAAGSFFAYLTSAGMGGYGAAAVAGVTQGVAAATAAGAGAAAVKLSKQTAQDDGDSPAAGASPAAAP